MPNHVSQYDFYTSPLICSYSQLKYYFILISFPSFQLHFTIHITIFFKLSFSKFLSIQEAISSPSCKLSKISPEIFTMAPRKSAQTKSSSSNPITKISDLIRDCNIPSSVNIRHITEREEKIWKSDGLEPSLLALGKRHIETLCFPLHPMILQILSIL